MHDPVEMWRVFTPTNYKATWEIQPEDEDSFSSGYSTIGGSQESLNEDTERVSGKENIIQSFSSSTYIPTFFTQYYKLVIICYMTAVNPLILNVSSQTLLSTDGE